MAINEQMVQDIVKEVMAKMQLQKDEPAGKQLGIFEDMNEAIAAAKEAQKVIRTMSMDQREQIISNIRSENKGKMRSCWLVWVWKRRGWEMSPIRF